MIRRLVAIRLRNAFLNSISGKDKNGNARPASTGRLIGFAFLYTFLFFVFLGMIFTMSMPIAMLLVPQGSSDLYFGIFTLLSLTVIFILSIFETKSELFECKDNELLLSMPIKTRDIIISRVSVVLIYNYITEAIVLIPVIVAYMIYGGSPIGIFGSIVLFVTLPLLATALASGVGYLVALISAKIARFKTAIVTVLFTVFFLLYFLGLNYLTENMDAIFEYVEGNINAIADKFSFIGFIGRVSLLAPLPLVIYLAIAAAASAICVFLISKSYLSIITSSNTSEKVVYKEKKLKATGMLTALVRKELARFTSSATYILNGALGYVFVLIIAGIIVFNGGIPIDIDPELAGDVGMDFEFSGETIAPFVIGAFIFCYSMTLMTAASVSIEGKHFWIVKSLPIPAKTLLLAKLIPSMLISVPIALITGIASAIASGVSFIYLLLYVTVPMAAAVAFNFIGLVFNCLFPKFTYLNEAEVVKQSLPVFLTMMVNLLLSLGAFAVLAIGAIIGGGEIALLAILFLFIVISVSLYFLLAGPLSRKLENINI